MLGQMVAKQAAGAVTATEGGFDAEAAVLQQHPGQDHTDGGGGDEELDGEQLVAGLRSEGTASSQAVTNAGARAKKAKIPKGREGLLLNALVADPRNVDALTCGPDNLCTSQTQQCMESTCHA